MESASVLFLVLGTVLGLCQFSEGSKKLYYGFPRNGRKAGLPWWFFVILVFSGICFTFAFIYIIKLKCTHSRAEKIRNSRRHRPRNPRRPYVSDEERANSSEDRDSAIIIPNNDLPPSYAEVENIKGTNTLVSCLPPSYDQVVGCQSFGIILDPSSLETHHKLMSTVTDNRDVSSQPPSDQEAEDEETGAPTSTR